MLNVSFHYSSNAFLAIHATLSHQVDLLPQPRRGLNGLPLDTRHALEVWVHQKHHMDFVPDNNERLIPLVGIAEKADECSGRLHSIFSETWVEVRASPHVTGHEELY